MPIKGISLERFYILSLNKSPYWLNHTTWVCTNHLPGSRFSAKLAVCMYNSCGQARPDLIGRPAAPIPVKINSKEPFWSDFPSNLPLQRTNSTLEASQNPPKKPLLEQPLQELEKSTIKVLRSFAANVLHIVGASKIKGGKVALLEAIRLKRLEMGLAVDMDKKREKALKEIEATLKILSLKKMDWLRSYANKELKIKRSSRIKGGKVALLERIKTELLNGI